MALGLSIAGLLHDRRKLLSLVAMLISASFTLLILVTRGNILSLIAALAR